MDSADTAKYSSIIRLQPHIKLANPVNVTMPCPWITTDHSYGVPPNLRLLAMMPANENEVSENSQWTWRDVTDVCTVTASENCCHFQTTFLTTYVNSFTVGPKTRILIDENSVKPMPSRLIERAGKMRL